MLCNPTVHLGQCVCRLDERSRQLRCLRPGVHRQRLQPRSVHRSLRCRFDELRGRVRRHHGERRPLRSLRHRVRVLSGLRRRDLRVSVRDKRLRRKVRRYDERSAKLWNLRSHVPGGEAALHGRAVRSVVQRGPDGLQRLVRRYADRFERLRRLRGQVLRRGRLPRGRLQGSRTARRRGRKRCGRSFLKSRLSRRESSFEKARRVDEHTKDRRLDGRGPGLRVWRWRLEPSSGGAGRGSRWQRLRCRERAR